MFTDTIAIGRNATAGTSTAGSGATALGSTASATGTNALAMGFGSGAAGATSLAAGSTASASATDAVALGRGASAANTGAVSLGAGSATAAAVATTSATIAGTTYNFAGVAPASTVSIGAASSERTLTNVAAGRVGTTSTDAVNGSQLAAANAAITDVDTRVDTLGANTASNFGGGSTYNAATGAVSAPSYTVNGASYSNVGSAINAIVNGGAGLKYFRSNSTLADASATGANTVAVGPVAAASASNAVALGNGATAAQAGAVALGSGAVTAAAVGTASSVIAGTTYNYAGSAPASTLSIGAAGSERTLTNLAAGRLSGSSTDAVNGSQLFATNAAVTDLDTRTDTLGTNVASNLGGGAAYDPATGAVSAPSYSVNGTPYSNVGDALAAITSGGGGIKYFRANSSLADATATGANSLAAGPLANAAGASAIAIGNDADAFSSDSVAIGRAAVAGVSGGTSGETAVGTTASATADQSSAFGFASQATGVGALAAGASATAAGANATALGSGASAAQDGAVALGAGSVSAAAVATASGIIAGTTYNYAGATPASTVSVGATGAERTLTNVAAGRVSGTSTDAVNGSQLFATDTAVTTLDTQVDTLGGTVATNLGGGSIYDPATGTVSAPTYSVGGTTYNNVGGAVTGLDDRIDTIANGAGIRYFHANSVLADSTASGIDSVAIGPAASASAANAVALGNGAVAGDAGAVALGAGSVSAAAVATASGTIAGTTYNYAGATPASTVSVGATGAERTLTNVAAGRVSGTSTDAVNGSQLFATNTAVTTLDTQVDTLGGTVATSLGGGSTYDPATGALTGPTYTIGGSTFTSVDGALTNIDGRVTQNTTDITQLTSQINNGSVGLVQQDAVSRTITVASTSDGGVVDMTGTQGARIITGVANGTVSAASLDAINGSQLYGVSQSLSSALGGGSTVNPNGTVSAPVYNVGGATFNSVGDAINHLASGGTQAKYFHANSLLADSAAGGTDSVSIGPAAVASANNAVALGNGASAGHADSVALGSGAQTTVGAQASYSGAYVGASTSTGEVAVGGRQVTGVAAGSAPSDAVNVSQLQSGVDSAVNQANQYTETRVTQLAGAAVSVVNLQQGKEGMFRVSVDNAATPMVSGLNAAAGGAGSTASGENSLAVGTASAASGPGAVAIGANAVASGPGSVAVGAGSVASGANTISVGSAGNERTISNVAAGTRDTDAVNVSQLRASQGSGPRYDTNADGSVNPNSLTLNPGGTPVSLHNIAAGVAPNDAVNVGQLQQAVGEVRGDIWEAQREARGGNASAMAMAGMPQAYVPGANMLAVGVGGFQGEVGMAVGLSGVTDSGRYVYKAQVSGNTTSDFGFAVGAGLQW